MCELKYKHICLNLDCPWLKQVCEQWPALFATSMWWVQCQLSLNNARSICIARNTLMCCKATRNTSSYDIYYQRYHIECITPCLTLNFKVKGQDHAIDIYIFLNSATYRFSTYKHQTQLSLYDVCYQRYHIECVTSCLTSNFKVKGQGHNYETYFL